MKTMKPYAVIASLACFLLLTVVHLVFSFWCWAGCYGPAENPNSHRLWEIVSLPLIRALPSELVNEYFYTLMIANSAVWGATFTVLLGGFVWYCRK